MFEVEQKQQLLHHQNKATINLINTTLKQFGEKVADMETTKWKFIGFLV